jgi:hypothetical protein
LEGNKQGISVLPTLPSEGASAAEAGFPIYLKLIRKVLGWFFHASRQISLLGKISCGMFGSFVRMSKISGQAVR